MKNILLTNADGCLGSSIARIMRKKLGSELKIHALAHTYNSIISNICDSVSIYSNDCNIDGDYDVENVAELCKKLSIDAIIPTTDHETVVFSHAKFRLPYLFCSDERMSKACYDKWEFCQLLERMSLPCPKTVLPSHRIQPTGDYLIKPRRGGLSRDIHFGSPSLEKFNDEYIVQEKLHGTEVTIAVFKAISGEVIGPLVAERTLFHGMTNFMK